MRKEKGKRAGCGKTIPCSGLPLPHKVKDEALQGVEVGARELINDRVHTSDGLLPLLQAWREQTQLNTLQATSP